MPMIKELLKWHKLMLMERSIGMISEEIIREFYASYFANDNNALPKNGNSLFQTPTIR